ncbi:unnamed protein product, partial [marine sediment metagenome]
DNSDHILLQQDFEFEFTEENDLKQFKDFKNINFLIYNSFYFATSNDGKTYYNTYGRTDKLEVIYKIKADNTWHSYIYSTSLSDYGVKCFNVTQFMWDNSLARFQDFAIEYVMTGNNSELTVNYASLNCSTSVKGEFRP